MSIIIPDFIITKILLYNIHPVAEIVKNNLIKYRDGYNEYGYNYFGYNKDGYNKDGYNIYRYDKFGYDKYGYSEYGKYKYHIKRSYSFCRCS